MPQNYQEQWTLNIHCLYSISIFIINPSIAFFPISLTVFIFTSARPILLRDVNVVIFRTLCPIASHIFNCTGGVNRFWAFIMCVVVVADSCTARGGFVAGGRGGGGAGGFGKYMLCYNMSGQGARHWCCSRWFTFRLSFTIYWWQWRGGIPDSFFINDQSSPYTNVNLNCNCLDPDEISKLNSEKITVFSVNIQSLPAKFSELSEVVNKFVSAPDVICLQETWQIMDNSFFPVANYHILETNLHSSAKGGGVGIYIKNHLEFNVLKQYSVFIERIFESLFFEISLPNK